MQNMKVDIVYYVIPADFEMEFNLNGCCPMRQLKTLTYSKKEYVEGLARAVSRSKIIIACGPIYGNDGLIKMTAKATHRPCEIINNADFGIAQDQNVEIIEESVPLVTSSGLFGGIIIESGPQTLIILSENKEIRKNIMQNLIHQYVREISILEIRRNSGGAELASAPAESQTEDALSEELTPENIAESHAAGEVIDFSVPEAAVEAVADSTAAAAPSDEALKAVADELNDLSSAIGKTLYANDNVEKDETVSGESDEREESSAAEAHETQAEKQAFPEPLDYEIELGDESLGEEHYAEEFKTQPQIDFTIDFEDTGHEAEIETDPAEFENALQKENVSIADFLFEGENEGEQTAPMETEKTSLNNFSFIADDDYEEESGKPAKNKLLNRSIIIIAAVLAVILLVLAYFLIYVPINNGVAPGDYIRGLLSAKLTIIEPVSLT